MKQYKEDDIRAQKRFGLTVLQIMALLATLGVVATLACKYLF